MEEKFTSLEKLKQIIRNRTVCITVHGKSIEKLEDYIYHISHHDICWAGMGVFPNIEQYILNRVNRQFDIVFDCATVAEGLLENYELNVRFPRIEEFLRRKNDNLWITSHGLIRDSVEVFRPDLLQHKNKILIVDHLFPEENRGKAMDVPNSVTLLIGAVIAGGARKIILFGLDGYKGEYKSGVESFYKPESIKRERLHALGSAEDPGINRDTDEFELKFMKNLKRYKTWFSNPVELVNCSPDSTYTNIRKINYEELQKELS